VNEKVLAMNECKHEISVTIYNLKLLFLFNPQTSVFVSSVEPRFLSDVL